MTNATIDISRYTFFWLKWFLNDGRLSLTQNRPKTRFFFHHSVVAQFMFISKSIFWAEGPKSQIEEPCPEKKVVHTPPILAHASYSPFHCSHERLSVVVPHPQKRVARTYIVGDFIKLFSRTSVVSSTNFGSIFVRRSA